MSPIISIAPNVSIRGIRPETLLAIWVAATIIMDEGFEAVVTSGVEGTHGTGSFHYLGLGVDLRTKHIPIGRRAFIRDRIARALGSEYDVLLENAPAHLHIEYQPKGPLNKLVRAIKKKLLKKRHVKKV
mgnify:CR=1 FL=1